MLDLSRVGTEARDGRIDGCIVKLLAVDCEHSCHPGW